MPNLRCPIYVNGKAKLKENLKGFVVNHFVCFINNLLTFLISG